MRIELQIASLFCIDGIPVESVCFGNGHINRTCLITTDTGKKYVLQKINESVFKNVDGLMANVFAVTEYIRSVAENSNEDISRCTLNLIRSVNGEKYVRYDGFYRLYTYIDNATSYDIADGPELTRALGLAVGQFQKKLDRFDASLLIETIPNFHNTESRYVDFERAVKEDRAGRASAIAEEIDFIRTRKNMCSVIVDKIANGEIPLRVTHNDTKLNNVLFDKDTREILCVIDLDTVMPGAVHYDFGDAVRFCSATAKEDERDLSKMYCDIDKYRGFCDGFLSVCGDRLNECEIELLPFSCRLLTFECGMRFLTDYLNGDIYFNVTRDGQNLDRARTQFKLVSDMESKKDIMTDIVKNFYNNH